MATYVISDIHGQYNMFIEQSILDYARRSRGVYLLLIMMFL